MHIYEIKMIGNYFNAPRSMLDHSIGRSRLDTLGPTGYPVPWTMDDGMIHLTPRFSPNKQSIWYAIAAPNLEEITDRTLHELFKNKIGQNIFSRIDIHVSTGLTISTVSFPFSGSSLVFVVPLFL